MKVVVKKIFLPVITLMFFSAFANAQSAYDLAMQELQKKGAVSCNPDEAYNLILSRDAGGRSSGLSLKIKPRLDPKTQMFVDGIDPELACRIAALMKSDPKIKVIHGYRSVADQRRLCGASGQSRGCAPPGRSCHNRGLAADLSFPKNYSRAYRQNLLSKFKLHLAYSSNAHVQCVEHKKANVDSCNTPCARAGVYISQNGSGPQSSEYEQQNDVLSQDALSSSPQQPVSPEPAYGQYQNPYPDAGSYQYAGGEAWEGVDGSELNDYNNWWSEYLDDDTGGDTEIDWATYKEQGKSIFDENISTGIDSLYRPALGFTGSANQEWNQVNSEQSPDSASGTTQSDVQPLLTTNDAVNFIRPSRSISDSSPKEAEFTKILTSKDSIVDYFVLSDTETSMSSNIYNKQETKDRGIIQNIFSWFINDDERRLKQGINQDIYKPRLSNTQNTNSDFANQISQIQVKDTMSRDVTSSNPDFRNIFSKTLDLSLFFSFPVLPIFIF